MQSARCLKNPAPVLVLDSSGANRRRRLPSLGVLTRDELRAGNEQIDAGAEKASRDPGSIRRIINV